MIFGHPGIGKSRLIQDYAKEKNLPLKDIRASYLDPTDIGGIPVPDLAANVAKFLSPDFLPKYPAIIFFDEINQAPPLVQSALYQISLDRRIRDFILPDTVQVIAAGNLPEDSNLVYELPPPLEARFIKCELMPPTLEAWTEWGIANKIDYRIIAFLQFKPHLLYDLGKKIYPRCWEFASDMIKPLKDLREIRLSVGGSLNGGVGYEFEAFIKLSISLNIEKLFFDNKIPERWSGFDSQGKYSVIGALAQIVNNTKNEETWPDLLIKVLEKVEAEFGALLVQMLDKEKGIQLISKDTKNLLTTKYFKLFTQIK